MKSKSKAAVIGELLIAARQIDSIEKDNLKLQNILGKGLYFKHNGKWHYNTSRRMTVKEISNLTKAINK